MKLLEYEAKSILRQYEIAVPENVVITKQFTPEVILPVIIKSQVPIGKRGKAGGIQIAKTGSELTKIIDNLFSLDIKGFIPQTLLAEELIDINREIYLGVVINLEAARIELLAHTNGGVEVEKNKKDSFLTLTLEADRVGSIGQQLADYYDLPSQTFALQELTKNLYSCFIQNDATLIEINPLVLTTNNTLVAGDCKMELDDAAGFRHPDWQFEEKITSANFVTLDHAGTVATIANGAGLAMATVDAVADSGLVPANFLDIGGGANEASVLAAFEKIMQYPNVRAIVINIFAGITRCDEVAKAIIAAKNQLNDLPPLFIRLAGTNFEQARVLLEAENIPLLPTLEGCLTAASKEIAS